MPGQIEGSHTVPAVNGQVVGPTTATGREIMASYVVNGYERISGYFHTCYPKFEVPSCIQ